MFWREPNVLEDKESLAALAPFLVYEFFSIFFEVFGAFAAGREQRAARIAATLGLGGAWLGFCYLFFSKGFKYDGLFWWSLACTQAWAMDIITKRGKVVGLAAVRAPCFLAALFAGAICQEELPEWGLAKFPPGVLDDLASAGMKQNLPVNALLFAMLVYCVWVASATVFTYLGPPQKPSEQAAKGKSEPPIKTKDLAGVGLFLGPFALSMLLGMVGITIPLPLVLMVALGPLLANAMGIASAFKATRAARIPTP